MSIKAIDSTSIRKITSAQVVTDLNSAVKEVVENSLDADAKNIEIKIFDYGKDRVEVIDDGNGIPKTEFENVAKKHMTSKINEFSDLAEVTSYGFRGEALASICEMAELEIVTCGDPNEPAAKLEFNRDGSIKSSKPIAGKRGTAVTIRRLFHSAVVRRKEFERNAKNGHPGLIRMLEAYAIIRPDVRFNIVHITNNKNRNVQLATDGTGDMLKAVGRVFGNELRSHLMEIDFSFDVTYSKRGFLGADDLPNYVVRVAGLVSKPVFGMGRNANDKQLLFVNKRPFTFKKLQKVFQDVYTSFVHLQKPALMINLELPPHTYDVNVSPDKRTIMLHNEVDVINSIREHLVDAFETSGQSVPRSTVDVKVQPMSSQIYWNVKDESMKLEADSSGVSCDSPISQTSSSIQNRITVIEERDQAKSDFSTTYVDETESLVINQMSDDNNGMADEEPGTVEPEMVEYGEGEEMYDAVGDRAEHCGKFHEELNEHQAHEDIEDLEDMEEHGDIEELEDTVEQEDTEEQDEEIQNGYRESNDDLVPEQYAYVDTSMDHELEEDDAFTEGDNSLSYSQSDTSFNSTASSPIISRRRVAKSNISRITSPMRPPSASISSPLSPSLSRPSSRKRTYANLPEFETFGQRSALHISTDDVKRLQDTSAVLGELTAFSNPTYPASSTLDDTSSAESKLNLTVSKRDFLKFHIIGQFNEAFIIVSNSENLFIIDQHASDEKFNFERLQKESKITPQPLVNPLTVELTPLEESVVSSNISLFKKNGFLVAIDDSLPPGQKCQIKGFPQTGGTVFGMPDFRELVVLFEENPGNNSVRPKKVRDIFASRACRGSVMVGTALKEKEMDRIVRNLAGLDKPWNCPHGRPTMRHLMEVDKWPVFTKDYES